MQTKLELEAAAVVVVVVIVVVIVEFEVVHRSAELALTKAYSLANDARREADDASHQAASAVLTSGRELLRRRSRSRSVH